MKRQRGRARRPNHGNRSFESNGPDVKIRGTANQIHEKYLQYGRDAHSSGDRVRSENFFQHAEHYYRLMVINGSGERSPVEEGESSGSVPGSGDQPTESRVHTGPVHENTRRRSNRPTHTRRPARPRRENRSEQGPESSISHGGGGSALDALAQEQATVPES